MSMAGAMAERGKKPGIIDVHRRRCVTKQIKRAAAPPRTKDLSKYKTKAKKPRVDPGPAGGEHGAGALPPPGDDLGATFPPAGLSVRGAACIADAYPGVPSPAAQCCRLRILNLVSAILPLPAGQAG